jgi:hypothetical protein
MTRFGGSRSRAATAWTFAHLSMLGHVRLETTQIYAQIRPAQLKRAVEFYEAKALDALSR